MSNDFWYTWYPSRYKTATRHLTAEQDGIYRRLIDEYMETREPLPDNDYALARIAGVNENKWLDASRILRAYFTHSDGMLRHEYCDKMLDIQDKKAKKRSESAEKAARKRWGKIKQKQEVKCDSHSKGNANAMRKHAIETETDIYIYNKGKKISLDDLSVEMIDDWLSGKRANGRYLDIDEHELLEMFKDYCRSKNPKYKDYIAAFRNSFKWQNAPKKGGYNGTRTTTSKAERAKEAIMRGITNPQ